MPKERSRGRLPLLVAGLFALAIGWIAWSYGSEESTREPVSFESQPSAHPGETRVPHSSVSKNEGITAASQSSASLSSAPSRLQPERIDSQRIRLILASGSSGELEAAFDEIARCVGIREKRQRYGAIDRQSQAALYLPSMEASLRRDEQFCLGADHDLISRHSEHLRDALSKRFSPGLANRYYAAGPLGNWSEKDLRPDDPLILAWYEEAKMHLERAAQSGDREAMTSLIEIYRNGPRLQRDPVKALGFLIAETELRSRNGEIAKDGPSANLIKQETAKVSPGDLEIARTQAKSLLEVCCNLKVHGGTK